MGADGSKPPPDWDDLAPPSTGPGSKRPGRHRQLGLRQIMLVMVYVAILLAVGRAASEVDGEVQRVALAVLVGVGVAGLGLWAAMRMTRFAFVGWTLFVIGYMIAIAGTILYLAIPSFPVLIGSIIYLLARRRATHRDSLLWVLLVAVERGMPLAPGVRAFSEQVSGIFQVWTDALAGLLEAGVPLPDALESLPRCASAEARVLIRSGHDSGQLASGLREAVESRRRRQPVMQSFGARVGYLCWVFLFSEGIVGFVLTFVMPRIAAIFEDFGMQLPRATTLLTGFARIVSNYGGFVLAGQVAVVGYLIYAFFSGTSLGLPLFDRFFLRRHTVLILRALAVAVESDRPIQPALDSLAQSYPTAWVRRGLEDAAAYARQGVDPIEALQGCELITSSDRGLLEAAKAVGNLRWAMLELAETAERRSGYRLQAGSQVLFVATLVGLGFVAFLIAIGCFAPLIQIITRLSQ